MTHLKSVVTASCFNGRCTDESVLAGPLHVIPYLLSAGHPYRWVTPQNCQSTDRNSKH